MIRQLFNNKWFIVGLAVGSVLLMGRSILVEVWDSSDIAQVVIEDPYVGLDIDEDFTDGLDEIGNAAGEFFDQLTASPADTSGSRRTVHHRRLTWNDEPRRDPFKAQMETELPLLASLTPVTTEVMPAGPPRLEALVAGPESSFAVFGDQVVTEGDRVAGYRIVRITPEGVSVASNTGSAWLPRPRRADANRSAPPGKDPDVPD